jgi:hypothetical protein
MYTMCMQGEIIYKAFNALAQETQRNITLEDFEDHYNCNIQRMVPENIWRNRDMRFNSEAAATYFLLRFS